MTKINLGERNELVLSSQAMLYKEKIAEEIEIVKQEKPAVNGNEAAKMEIAAELIFQGLSDEAVCRILNISPELLPEKLHF